MALTGIEPLVAGLVKRLQDDLPAAIDAVNQEAGAMADGILLEPAQQILAYLPPAELLLTFPTVGVTQGPTTFEDDEGYEATSVNELAVCIYLQNPDQEQLVTQLRRYSLAVLRTIMTGRVIPHATVPDTNAAWGVTLRRIDPGRTLGEYEAQQVVSYMSSTRIVITAKADEIT